MMKTVRVTQYVKVEIDENKFDDDFMADFRKSFYDFHTHDEHIEHLGQLEARGMIGLGSRAFVEGYGPCGEMGIKTEVERVEMEIDD